MDIHRHYLYTARNGTSFVCTCVGEAQLGDFMVSASCDVICLCACGMCVCVCVCEIYMPVSSLSSLPFSPFSLSPSLPLSLPHTLLFLCDVYSQ